MMNKVSIRNSKYAKIGLLDLIKYINDHSPIPTSKMDMVEIGCYVGDSTKIFAEHFKSVTAIDPYMNGYDDNDAASYQHPMAKIKQQFIEDVLIPYKNVVHYEELSVTVANNLHPKHQYHFVYIDGNHTKEFLKNDIVAWKPRILSGCFIGGHDYANKNAPEVEDTVNLLLGIPDQTFRDSSWIKEV